MIRIASYILPVLVCLAASQPASAEKTVFIGSPEYEVTVQLSYTRETGPEGEQGGFSGYAATGTFQEVKFGPSPAEGFECWFQQPIDVPSARAVGAAIPTRSISGQGAIDDFTIAPAWEDPAEAIEPRITGGPKPFAPSLQLLTFEMAHAEGQEDEGDLPVVPIVPTVWFLYSEGFSADGNELSWKYPGFAVGCIECSQVIFSVELDRLANGEDIELNIPYDNPVAKGEWKIIFGCTEQD